MKKPVLTAFAFAAVSLGLIQANQASAQNAVLAEMYGRGVHAYYSGRSTDAYNYLSMAINNGIKDPRAYYFRGMVLHAQGRSYEAEADWQSGAQMEATGRANPTIGRSLARFQGSSRIKLEEIRQQARLQALANQMQRSKQRYGELGAASGPEDAPPPPVTVPPTGVKPPPAPPVAEDPFADDVMAEGAPAVTADDALEGAMEDPFAGEAGAGGAAPAAGGADPFGGGGAGADPFGGGDAGADPFGGAGDAGADPFGGGGDAGADPFGGGGGADPFGGAGGDDPFGGADGGDPFGS